MKRTPEEKSLRRDLYKTYFAARAAALFHVT